MPNVFSFTFTYFHTVHFTLTHKLLQTSIAKPKGPVIINIINGRGDRVQMIFYEKIFRGPLIGRKFSQPTRHRVTIEFLDTHSRCKLFMFFGGRINM